MLCECEYEFITSGPCFEVPVDHLVRLQNSQLPLRYWNVFANEFTDPVGELIQCPHIVGRNLNDHR